MWRFWHLCTCRKRYVRHHNFHDPLWFNYFSMEKLAINIRRTIPVLLSQSSRYLKSHWFICLVPLTYAFWAVHDAAVKGRWLEDQGLPMMLLAAHIRHCIDLLWHSLMYQPDTTIEKKDDN